VNGEIKRVVVDKGLCFIHGEDGVEYFAHSSAFLTFAVFQFMRQGERVTFEPTQGPKGPRAEQVRLA
jgi:CspA family cold shock protein